MKKHKLNIDRPEINSEQIKKRMDFDSFLKEYEFKSSFESNTPNISKPVSEAFVVTKGWFISTVLITAMTCSVVTYLYTRKDTEVKKIENKNFREINIPYEESSTNSFALPNSDKGVGYKNTPLKNEPKYLTPLENKNLKKTDSEISTSPEGNKVLKENQGDFDTHPTNTCLEEKNATENSPLSPSKKEKESFEKRTESVPNHNDSKDHVPPNISSSSERNLKEEKYLSKRQLELSDEIKILESQIEKKESIKSVKPQQAHPSRYHFYLDVLAKEFPEIVQLKGILFEIGKENNGFKEEEVNSITWKRLELSEGSEFGNYTLHLSKGKIKKTFIVYPVYESKDYISAMKQYHASQGELLKMKDDLKNKKDEMRSLGLDAK